MNINTFREKLKSKTFRSRDGGILFRFVGDNTLQVNNRLAHSAHYSIEDSDGKFLLHHNSLLGTEPLLIEVLSMESPMELSMSKFMSREFMGTWIEITS